MHLDWPDDSKSSSDRRAEPMPRSNDDSSVKPARSGASYRNSEDIFDGLREIVILHNGGEYRLRITASGKLILTK